MPSIRPVLVAAALTLVITPALSAKSLILDLGVLDPGQTHSFSVAPGDYSVELRNRLPGLTYSFNVEVTVIPIPPLPSLAQLENRIDSFTGLTSACQTVAKQTTALANATDEKQVRARAETLKHELGTMMCQDEAILQPARDLLSETSLTLAGPWTVVRGEELKVTVRRVDNTGGAVWTVIYSAGPRGEWQTSYGFSFLPDGDEEYFLAQSDDTFVVTEKKDREELDFAPGVFFTWVPRKKLLANLSIGPTAGLGFDLDNPVVFAGAAFTWNQNISLVLGAALHQERRLAGRYNTGDELTENLEPDQLHETTYAPTWFAGISFRFGSNPFGSDEGSGN